MPTTLRLLVLLMLGLLGLKPVSYAYDAPVAFASEAQNIVAASPETETATVESAAPVLLNFSRTRTAWDNSESIGLSSNFVAAESGAASSLQGALLRQQLAAEEAAGVRAPTSISNYADHALEQIANRDGGIGVSKAALEDAFNNPNAMQYAPSKYGPTFRYIGNKATVVVNPDGTVVTGWATNSGGVGP